MARSSEVPVRRPQARAKALINTDLLPGVSWAKALFLLAAFASFLMSVSLWFSGDRERGVFVGIWVPSILSAGALLVGKENRDD